MFYRDNNNNMFIVIKLSTVKRSVRNVASRNRKTNHCREPNSVYHLRRL